MDEITESAPNTTLAQCPDCLASISPSAEICPHCGKLFMRQPVEVVPGPRWSWTVYWGIVLFVIIPVLISAVFSVLLFLIIVTAMKVQS